MYKLKQMAKRGSAFAGAVGLLAAIGTSALPSLASANDLNPLTERSLTLSSSSPGWAYTDGSGNSTYAPPNSGANGQKTGNYFSFKVSSTATVKTFSFQYCTTSAGDCTVPGNDATPGSDTSTTSDLNVNYPSATEVGSGAAANTPAGTMTLTSGMATVTGNGTSFTSLRVGGTFTTAGGNTYVIKSISSPTQLVITSNAVASESAVAYTMSDFEQVVNTGPDSDPSAGLVKAVPGYTNNNPKYQADGGKGDAAEAAKNVAGNFIVMYHDSTANSGAGGWVQSTGWTAEADNVATGGSRPADHNYITLTNTSGVALTANQQVKILFFANSTNYITNPGADAFFVKINTYNVPFDNTSPAAPAVDLSGLAPVGPTTNIIDGGVTVANVMNQSIQITTKVLETMEFSVGTVDPDTLTDTQLTASADGGTHASKTCGIILTGMTPSDSQNVLQLGNQTAESSLETGHTYATHSYWRLSSNSSAGATIYYSGHTLSNTSGDEITPIGTTAVASATGSEQFGLALDAMGVGGSTGVAKLDNGTYGVDYTTAGTYENGADNSAAGVVAANAVAAAYAADPANNPAPLPGDGVDPSVLTDLGADLVTPDYSGLNKSYHTPKLDPLVPTDGTNGTTDYGHGSGTITNAGTAKFAFDPLSDTVPAAIATENNQVVDCVTGKMRYIGNIAATTPAGIYTTKVNYIAAPQY